MSDLDAQHELTASNLKLTKKKERTHAASKSGTAGQLPKTDGDNLALHKSPERITINRRNNGCTHKQDKKCFIGHT